MQTQTTTGSAVAPVYIPIMCGLGHDPHESVMMVEGGVNYLVTPEGTFVQHKYDYVITRTLKEFPEWWEGTQDQKDFAYFENPDHRHPNEWEEDSV